MKDKDNKNLRWPIWELWVEYEKVAMHFNDLILRLRMQALAAVAAISTIVGLFSKNGQDVLFNWQIATAIFIALIFFWVAVWLIDFGYYNKLLRGAVAAIIELERASQDETHYSKIELSTKIKEAVESKNITKTHFSIFKHAGTRFYLIVLILLIVGVCYSYSNSNPAIIYYLQSLFA